MIVVGLTDAAGFWQTGALASVLENGTLTILLVEGFTGSAGTDLDAGNDGTLDTTPWTRLVDAVSFGDGDAGDQAYGVPVLGDNFDGLDTSHPGGASRLPDGADTDLPADWKRNDYDGQGFPGVTTGTPVPGEAINTPGAANAAAP